MKQGGDDRQKLTEVIPQVEKAATQAAIQVLGAGARDLIEEVVAEVYLRLVRAWHKSPPENPAGWAFIVGTNCAKRLGKRTTANQKHHIHINDHLVLQSPNGPDERSTISVEAALEALDGLIALANGTIHDVGAEIDRKIFVLFHVRGQSWEQIAAVVDLTTTAVHRRYYRLIRRVAGVVREHAMKDPVLSDSFHAILTDEDIFRCALLSLLNVVGRKGFPAIRRILESFLS